MGKWSQVRCNCPNRMPVPNSNWQNRPYGNFSDDRLSNKQKREIKLWEENIKGVYRCGHTDGMLVQLYPGKIIKFGFVLREVFKNESTFEVFSKVANWRNYFSEELTLSAQDAELWLMEVEELEQAFYQQGNLPYSLVCKLILVLCVKENKFDRNLLERLESITDQSNFARVVPFLDNLDRETKSPEVLLNEQFNILNDVRKLCLAAIETGNPITFLW